MTKKLRPPAHTVPKDLKEAVKKSDLAAETWKLVTPLAKSEWSCWVMSAKKQETREKRVRVAVDKLERGERRPCCWAGCPHR